MICNSTFQHDLGERRFVLGMELIQDKEKKNAIKPTILYRRYPNLLRRGKM